MTKDNFFTIFLIGLLLNKNASKIYLSYKNTKLFEEPIAIYELFYIGEKRTKLNEVLICYN